MTKNHDEDPVKRGAVKKLLEQDFWEAEGGGRFGLLDIGGIEEIYKAIDSLPAVPQGKDSWVLEEFKKILKKKSAFTAHIVYGYLLKQLTDLESQAPAVPASQARPAEEIERAIDHMKKR